jgi:hypothetical protein
VAIPAIISAILEAVGGGSAAGASAGTAATTAATDSIAGAAAGAVESAATASASTSAAQSIANALNSAQAIGRDISAIQGGGTGALNAFSDMASMAKDGSAVASLGEKVGAVTENKLAAKAIDMASQNRQMNDAAQSIRRQEEESDFSQRIGRRMAAYRQRGLQ